MAWTHSSQPLVALTLSLGLVMSGGMSSVSQAEPTGISLNTQTKSLRWNPPQAYQPPSNIGSPQRRDQAGTRGSCLETRNTTLTLLMPESSFGRTTASYPTFLARIPASSAEQLQFELKDQDDNTIYQTTLSLTGKAGIVSVTVPDSEAVPPLEVNGKTYLASVRLICDPLDSSANLYASGVIQRVEPSASLLSELEQTAFRNHPSLYAEEGLWLETVTTLAELRNNRPNDISLNNDWQTLLSSVGLDEISQEPIVAANPIEME